MHEHIDIERLSAYAEGELSAPARARVEQHLATCATCHGTLQRLRGLVRAAAALPHEVAVPEDLWPSIAARARAPRRRWHGAALASLAALAAAAVVAAAVLNPSPGRSAKQRAGAPSVPPVTTAVDRSYEASIAELRFTLEQQRASLSPATLRVLERSVIVIDSAIAEARAALAADPGNDQLSAILAAQYEHKIGLLQRAARLSPAT